MVSQSDRTIVRDLARRAMEYASLPIMEQRRQMWTRHNRLDRVRPMVLVFPEGSWAELLPESVCRCEDRRARQIEWAMRRRIMQHELLNDDNVIADDWEIQKAYDITSWGLEARRIPSTAERGSWMFDPVLKTMDDVAKLTLPRITPRPDIDAERVGFATDLLGDTLPVRLAGTRHISFHLMAQFTALHGLDQTLMTMVDNPELMHAALGVLEAGNRGKVEQMFRLGLVDLNNNGAYHSSGGVGFSDELPRSGFDGTVRPCDMWASAETQEFALVSPRMHEEFAMQYDRRLLAPFGLTGYGCCEDLTNKLDMVFSVPTMRRVSISPFANVDTCAERMGRRAIFSWKPHPAHLVGPFDERMIRDYIRHALDVTRGCVIEMILKDTHTCENHPERFARWTQIARELAEQY